MADLNINKSDNVKGNESLGNNPVQNSGFESAPTFVAATTAANKWIDGTALGSGTDDSHFWANIAIVGTASSQFDSSTSNSGSNSMKVSTSATGSRVLISHTPTASTAATNFKYCIPCAASTLYKVTYAQRTNYVSGDATSGAIVQLFDVDASGVQGAGTNSTAFKTTTAWTTYSFTRTTASTAAYLMLQIGIIGNNGVSTLIMDAWFDDISVYPITRINGVDVPIGPTITPGVQDISGPKIWS
jgi:hypothetical protein